MNKLFLNYSPEIRKYLGWYTTPLLIGVILTLFAVASWYITSAWKIKKDISQIRQISISGEGKVAVKPDAALFNAGIITSAARIGDAQRENTINSNAVINFIKKKGVEDKDIKTIGYHISPQYQYFDTPVCLAYPCPPRKPPVIVSYEVRHNIEIKVRDLGKVDELLEGVVENGANEVGSIRFSVDDEEKAKAEARKIAIENAKAKAKVLASDLGVRLDRIISFSESGGGFPIFAQTFEAKGGFGGDVEPTPRVEPGEQEIKSVVTITYEFR